MDEKNNQKTLNPSIENTLKEKMKIKWVRDILVYVGLGLIFATLVFLAFFLKPKSNLSYVHIQYDNTLLWDKNDTSKNTNISFPQSGEKKISFADDDSSLFLTQGKTFDFCQGGITFTLYSDCSIEVKTEDVSCRDHLCSKQGRIYQTYTPIVCLPNHMSAMIISSSGPEYDL